MKLSFFKKESLLKGRFSFYLLLNHDVSDGKEMDFFTGVDGGDDVESEEESKEGASVLDHFTKV